MIGYLNGTIAHVDPAKTLLDINGVGYEVNISLATYSAMKNESRFKLYTYLHVREDVQLLYGFATPEEKQLFLHLISISGVGPGTALMILSSLSSEELKRAIIQGNAKQIQSVKGIGAKSAQRIILELKDKIIRETDEKIVDDFSSQPDNTLHEEALSALVTLGFSKAQAEKGINQVIKTYGSSISLEELVKLALKSA